MGNIYLRNKTWWGDYTLNGERIRKPLSKNRREAKVMHDELSSMSRFRRHGLVPQTTDYKVFKTLYLKIRKDQKRPNTYAHTDLAFRRLDEVFYIKHIQQITPELLEDAKLKWKKKEYTDAAIGSYVMQIKVAMKTAEAWRYTMVQPWRMVKGHVSAGRLIYYTIEELQMLISMTKEKWRTALLLMARAGLRSGEVRHLEWEDIAFDDGTLYIHSKPFWKPKGWTAQKPHDRRIDMPEDLQAHLQSIRRPQGFVLGPDLVPDSTYAQYFQRLIKDAFLKGSAHCFRHTYASHLISNGATLEEVGELLGHTNPITTKMYSHLLPHARKRAVSRLPALVPELCRTFPPNKETKGTGKHEITV